MNKVENVIFPEIPVLKLVFCEIAGQKFPVHAASARMEAYHANGGDEGFVVLASETPAQIRFVFPCPVRSAVFRPSLKSTIPVRASQNHVDAVIPPEKYGMLEVNFDNREGLPVYSMAILCEKPRLAAVRGPGSKIFLPGFHSLEEIAAAEEARWIFLPGAHRFESGRLRLRSDLEICLETGSVLKCSVEAIKCCNLTISGCGLFDGSETARTTEDRWIGSARDSFLWFVRCENWEIDGPIAYNTPYWCLVPEGSKHGRVRNFKTICWVCNTDAIQPRSCDDLLVEHCFFKCDDDCIAIKTRREYPPVTGNLTFRNIVCCNEAASAMEIGHSSQGDLLKDIRFESIECIRGFWGFCHICLADHAAVRNVLYQDIFIENNLRHAPEISFETTHSEFSAEAETGSIAEVVIRNLYLEQPFRGVKLLGDIRRKNIEKITLDGIFLKKRRIPAKQLRELVLYCGADPAEIKEV